MASDPRSLNHFREKQFLGPSLPQAVPAITITGEVLTTLGSVGPFPMLLWIFSDTNRAISQLLERGEYGEVGNCLRLMA